MRRISLQSSYKAGHYLHEGRVSFQTLQIRCGDRARDDEKDENLHELIFLPRAMASRDSGRNADKGLADSWHMQVPSVQISALEAMREQSIGGLDEEVYRNKQFPFRIQTLLRRRKRVKRTLPSSPLHEVVSLPLSPSHHISSLSVLPKNPQVRLGGGFLFQRKLSSRPLQKSVSGRLPKLYRVYLN